jgi:hypothetical protein
MMLVLMAMATMICDSGAYGSDKRGVMAMVAVEVPSFIGITSVSLSVPPTVQPRPRRRVHVGRHAEQTEPSRVSRFVPVNQSSTALILPDGGTAALWNVAAEIGTCRIRSGGRKRSGDARATGHAVDSLPARAGGRLPDSLRRFPASDPPRILPEWNGVRHSQSLIWLESGPRFARVVPGDWVATQHWPLGQLDVSTTNAWHQAL